MNVVKQLKHRTPAETFPDIKVVNVVCCECVNCLHLLFMTAAKTVCRRLYEFGVGIYTTIYKNSRNGTQKCL